MTRWALLIKEFNIQIKDIRDPHNIESDALSRVQFGRLTGPEPTETAKTKELRVLAALTKANVILHDIIPKRLSQEIHVHRCTVSPRRDYYMFGKQSPLESEWNVILPAELQVEPLHLSGVTFLRSLQMFKNSGEHLQGMVQPLLPEFPLSLVASDFLDLSLSPYQERKILLDKCKKFVQELGKPTTVIKDKETQFTSKIWSTGLTKMGVKTTSISVRHPHSNPIHA
ncbi:hypothetical protein PR048_022597 [Dryococelus australis]|uniref:Uncharacterized protein n=1 Tax=Dryococelus australis TaxID=614101 RepID=A0ABQ9H1E6_9NEOP|nr:hypothetical protein PR048_022597 [Dryococelus australis]